MAPKLGLNYYTIEATFNNSAAYIFIHNEKKKH